MAEKPILFSGEMVRAILDGRKTQTRRVIKQMADAVPGYDVAEEKLWVDQAHWYEVTSPYGRPGDRLWVRETWQAQSTTGEWWHEVPKRERELHNWSIIDRATNEDFNPPKWIPSIFMPRWASRILLEVTAVRVERLQDISEDDAVAEGVAATPFTPHGWDKEDVHRDGFRVLWDSINRKRGYGWDVNPFVWVVEFKQVRP